jgi:hypothetical protein
MTRRPYLEDIHHWHTPWESRPQLLLNYAQLVRQIAYEDLCIGPKMARSNLSIGTTESLLRGFCLSKLV